MILILTDQDEPTTDLVIDWLNFLKKKYIRISIENKITIQKVYQVSGNFEALFTVEVGNKKEIIDTKSIQSYWYRRSELYLYRFELEKNFNLKRKEQKSIQKHLDFEHLEQLRILYDILDRKHRINSYKDNRISKLDILQKAQSVGLLIPNTIICNDKETLKTFYFENNCQLITKSIGDPFGLNELGLHHFTSKIDIDKIPDTFGNSLFQEMLTKILELRIFYLHGKIFSSAIFSQRDLQTQIDFRHYNLEKPNRVIPFQLPAQQEQKICELMKLTKLNSGSIDMILNDKGQYVFLEINPIGQFEQVSIPCNYNLFKKVAEIL